MPFTITAEIAQELVPGVKILSALRSSAQKAAFKAERNGQLFALKIYDPQSSVQRVEREMKAMSSIISENVVRFDEFHFVVTRTSSVIYSLEEFIEGDDLANWLSSGAKFNENELLKFLKHILNGLVTLAENNLVHRDIKPANIMLRADGTPVIIDLGLARHLDMDSLTMLPQGVMGPCTPMYAAPEQLTNDRDNIKSRTDLYAIGLVAFECFTGNKPYWDESVSYEGNLDRSMKLPTPKLEGVSQTTARFVEKLMQRPGHLRFSNPKVALERLNEVLKDLEHG
jgi:eukaryotic-like serine/threonine-protein kinase